jgi:hypothetical protein
MEIKEPSCEFCYLSCSSEQKPMGTAKPTLDGRDSGKRRCKRTSEVCQDGYWNCHESKAGEVEKESVFFTRSKI